MVLNQDRPGSCLCRTTNRCNSQKEKSPLLFPTILIVYADGGLSFCTVRIPRSTISPCVWTPCYIVGMTFLESDWRVSSSDRTSLHIEWIHSGCLPKCHSDLYLQRFWFLFFRYRQRRVWSPLQRFLGLPKDVTCDLSFYFFLPLLIPHLVVSSDKWSRILHSGFCPRGKVVNERFFCLLPKTTLFQKNIFGGNSN